MRPANASRSFPTLRVEGPRHRQAPLFVSVTRRAMRSASSSSPDHLARHTKQAVDGLHPLAEPPEIVERVREKLEGALKGYAKKK